MVSPNTRLPSTGVQRMPCQKAVPQFTIPGL
jgi:hypothetical protein